MLLELDVNGNQTAKNIYGIKRLKRNVTGKDQYYLCNAHGDVTALVDRNGNMSGRYDYDAFGNLTEEVDGVGNPYKYAGEEHDSETGLYNLKARYYSPKTARFVSEDSYRGRYADPLSLNLYTYCHNEPVMYVDPSGHAEIITTDKNGKIIAARVRTAQQLARANQLKAIVNYTEQKTNVKPITGNPKNPKVTSKQEKTVTVKGFKVPVDQYNKMLNQRATGVFNFAKSAVIETGEILVNSASNCIKNSLDPLFKLKSFIQNTKTAVSIIESIGSTVIDLKNYKTDPQAAARTDQKLKTPEKVMNNVIESYNRHTQLSVDQQASAWGEMAPYAAIDALIGKGALTFIAKKATNIVKSIKFFNRASEIEDDIIEGGFDENKIPSPKGLFGKDFEDYLTKNIGGDGSFSVGGRDFDGGIENKWWEAKSGTYFESRIDDPKAITKFKSDMGDRLKIAQDNGATYELYSNTPILEPFKDYLIKKGIPFTELID